MRKNITYSFFFINLDGQQIYKTVTIATNRPKAGQDCNKLITDFLSLTVQRYNNSEKTSLKHSVHFVCNPSALLDFDTKDIEMRNVFHDVGRKVGLDDTLTAKTTDTSFRFVPI